MKTKRKFYTMLDIQSRMHLKDFTLEQLEEADMSLEYIKVSQFQTIEKVVITWVDNTPETLITQRILKMFPHYERIQD